MEAYGRGSVTIWIDALRAADRNAANQLWRRNFGSLVRLSRSWLRSRAWAAADEEEVALSAFDSFYGGMGRGRFTEVADRADIWGLLATIAARKASDDNRWESGERRGGGRVLQESDLADVTDPGHDGLGLVVGTEPSPEFAALVADECGRRLRNLPGESLRSVALRKMEGFRNEEIAARLGCGPRTGARRPEVIRLAWRDEVTP